MGFFDFLANKGASAPYNAAASPSANEGIYNTGGSGGGFDFKGLMSNPNFIQALGSMGSGISQGQPAGQAIGNAAVNYSRNQAMQGATAKQLNTQDDRLNMVLEALGRSGMLSSVDKNDKADWFKVDGNGSWTMGMKNTPQKSSFGGEEPALESKSTQPRQRNNSSSESNFL